MRRLYGVQYKKYSKKLLIVVFIFGLFLSVGVGNVSAVVKVLSNSTHAYSTIRSTITQLLGSGHLDVDVIVHRTALDNTTSGLSAALDTSATFYDASGGAVSSQAPYQIFTTSFTGYTGDTISLYNQYDGTNLTHNYAFTVSTNSPPPAFYTAPGGDGWSSSSGVEWTIDPNIFNTASLSSLTAANAGIMASLSHEQSAWNLFDIKAALRQTGTNWDSGYDNTDYGFGIINYASSTALTSSGIFLQPPVSTTTVSSIGQITFTLYPFKQTRRVKEALFQFNSNPGFQASELSLSDITTLGGTKITDYSTTTASSSIIPIYTAFSNKYFVWFTADNSTDGSANFSRVDTYSVLGPVSQSQIDFNSSFDISSPADNAIATTSPTFTWETADSFFDISKYQLFVDGSLDTDNIASTTLSAAPSTVLSEGTHTWYIKAINGSSNATSSVSIRTINMVSSYIPSYTWYVDNVLGNDSNKGSSALPWSTISKASVTAQPGNTVVVIKNDGSPYREVIAPVSGNTTDGNIVFRGVDVNSKPEIWGSDNVAQSVVGGWTSYGGGNANTYQKSLSTTVTVFAGGSSTSTLSARTKGSAAASLNEGEWYYTGGVLYYRLNSGEDINTLFAEASQRSYGIDCSGGNTFKDIVVKWASSGGAYLRVGCIGERLELYDSVIGVYMFGGGTESNLGPILRYSVVEGNTSKGIYLIVVNYSRVYNNTIYNNGTGLSAVLQGNNSIVKNNVFNNNTANFEFVSFPVTTTFIASNNNWSSGTVDSLWDSTYKGSDNQESKAPSFTNTTSRNFRLKKLSPNIDTGTSISGLSTDILGNPIYGTPDIGAYEYQPPYTITSDRINITSPVRVYKDGKYRPTTATTTGTQAYFQVTPKAGFPAGDYSEWLNVTVSDWQTSGTYAKTWTEESSIATTTVHTIGDLKSDTNYNVLVDGVQYAAITTNENGIASFDYDGGYSVHTFSITEVPIGNGPIVGTFGVVNTQSNPGPSSAPVVPAANTSSPQSFVVEIPIATFTATSTEQKLVEKFVEDVLEVAPGYKFSKYLQIGSQSTEVTQLQQKLRELGYFTYPENTGYFGHITQTAVKAFQKANNIEQVGVVGPQTRRALNAINTIESITQPQPFIFSQYIIIGTRSSEVTQLQQKLRELGFFTFFKNTGYFGSITGEAVKAFQKANNIEQVGVVGPQTRSALNSL